MAVLGDFNGLGAKKFGDARLLESFSSVRDGARGGDVALRGIGMAIFARAFLYCKDEGIDVNVMASRLAELDWHLLSCERSDLPTGPTYSNEVQKKALAMWSHLLVIGESRYRVSSSSADADTAWQKILSETFEKIGAAA